jgi:restriction system protein
MFNKVPAFEVFMRPVLEAVQDGQIYTRQQVAEKVAEILQLSDEAKQIKISSGRETYEDRTQWSMTYLKQAGALETRKRGEWRITERGLDLLAKNQRINRETLQQFAEFQAFEARKGTRKNGQAINNDMENIADVSTDELINNAERLNTAEVKSDLLNKLKKTDPYYFEQVCVDVLTAMNYGGGKEEFASVTKKTSDGGIDGVIKQDPLGLSNVYVQAKRWENDVQEKQIRDFLGALVHQNAQQGVFITTSLFSEKARQAAKNHQFKVALIDGEQLVALMVKYKVGVQAQRTVELLRVDEDYFSEE